MSAGLFVEAGDIRLIDFEPTKGTEQSGTRPAIVVSSSLMHSASRRIIVCPITNNMAPWPTKVHLPRTLKTNGMVLTDQIRAIDLYERDLRYIEKVDADFLFLVRSYVGRLLDLEAVRK
jgi:mRNA interferase MazF